MSLNGWHVGERVIRKKLNFDQDYSTSTLFTHIEGELPPDHAYFHSTRLPFLPVTTLDESGRPWGSILAGRDGRPGFITHPRTSTLVVKAKVWDGDPLIETSTTSGSGDMLVAGIGIEFPTRRRNKFAGKISRLERDGDEFDIEMRVNEAIGNCPKYINVRDVVPHIEAFPIVTHRQLRLSPHYRLPDAVISFIQQSDTVFLGTTYRASSVEATRYPSHVGMNHRGGSPGFIRVSASDGRTVVLPDFSGNRFMTSLGNVEATPYASLTFVSFINGDILYLTGSARNLTGLEARSVMPLQNTLTTVYTTGYIYVSNALPVRQRTGTPVQHSPYSPPVRYLAEETPQSTIFDEKDHPSALLTRVDLHSPSIATFTWESSQDLRIKSGQAIILDLSTLVGTVKYQHMAPTNPTSLNDDRKRTWTVSSFQPSANSRSFSITIREKPGGVATTALFTIARKLFQMKPELLADSRPLQLAVTIVGVTGDFVLPTYNQGSRVDKNSSQELSPICPRRNLFFIAGGIGITPFLSMLKGLATLPEDAEWDIRMALSTREPDVLLPLISSALGNSSNAQAHIFLDRFSGEAPLPDIKDFLHLRPHAGRISSSYFADLANNADLSGRDIFLCGPEPFEKGVLDALTAVETDITKVRREGFEY